MRLSWVDNAKGFAIILVVVGHVWRGLDSAGMLETGLFRAVDDRIYAFHMPLFFLLAGLFFPATLDRLDSLRFVLTRLSRLIYPLLLWTYIFIGFKLAAGSMANTPIGLEELFIPPIPGRWHFWFLWALFVIHIALMAVRPVLAPPRWRVRGAVLVLLVSLLLYPVDYPGWVDFWFWPAIKHLPYFAAGMIIGGNVAKLRAGAGTALTAAAVFALIQLFYVQLYQGGVPYLVTAMALSLATVAVFVWLGDRGGLAARALNYAGQRSMAIFLSHVIFAAGLREVLIKLGVFDVTVHLIAGSIAGLILPIILNDLAKRLNFAKILGF